MSDLLENFKLPLVNAHCHAAMIAFKGLAEDKPLKEWLEKYIWPLERKMVNKEMVKTETKKAIKEMKRNKIAFFADMYFFEDQVAEAAIEENMPVLIGEVLLDFPTPSYKNFNEGLLITEKLLDKYKNHCLIKTSVAPHSIYTVSSEHLVEAKKLAKKYNVIYHIHCSETKQEFDDCLKKYNKTPVQYLEKLGVLDEKTLLAHCVWLDDKDIKILSKRKVKVAHCPLSNSKLGSGIAPIVKLLKNNVLVCLGTDGAGSSNRLDIWEAGKYAALSQKAINLDPTVLPIKEVIKMLTINGMKALGLEILNGKNIKQWEKELQKNNYSFLYSSNFS
ncbi:amidohydrolase [Candidatus Parcubacteria bacterium]|nr:amidohydrolase [Candidatus Parcubacteria bacterium]